MTLSAIFKHQNVCIVLRWSETFTQSRLQDVINFWL